MIPTSARRHWRLCAVALAALAACTDAVTLERIPHLPIDDMGPRAAEHLRAESERLLAVADDGGRESGARAEAFTDLGRLLQAYGLHGPAAVAYRNALTLGADLDPTGYLLGVATADLGDGEAAAALFERLLAVEPAHHAARLRLAEIDLEAGRLEPADAGFAAVIAERPQEAAALAGQGKVALASGDYETAVESLSAALESQPRANSLHRLLAQAYARIGDGALAEQHRAQAGDRTPLIADPDMARVQSLGVGAGNALRRGDGAMLAGDFQAAVAAYRQAVAADPADPSAHHSLAASLFRTGNLEEARETYRQAASLDPGSAALRHSLGVTELRLGRAGAAVAEFRQALALEERAEYRLGLAEAYWLSGDKDSARDELDRVLEADPDSAPAQAALVRVLIDEPRGHEDVQRALELAGGLVERQPTVAHVELMASVYAAAGRHDLAADWQRRLIERVGDEADQDWRRRAEQTLRRYEQKSPPA